MNKIKSNSSTSKSSRGEEAKNAKKKSEEEGELDENSAARASSDSKRIKLMDKSEHHEEEDDAEESDDAISSSSSDDSSAELANDETQLSTLVKKLDKLKKALVKDQHKYEKIERALAKAKIELNESNVKKCKKYKLKYEKKINKIKEKIDAHEKKIARIRSKFKLAKKSKPDVASAKQDSTTTSQKQPPQPAVVKLPYPVLNDKRDMNIILHTLETKLNELLSKIVANRQLKQRPGQSKDQLDKVNQLERTYESQRQKLIRQIDYIRLSLAVRATNSGDPTLVQQLNELYQMMKNENMQYLKANNPKETTEQPDAASSQTSPKSGADSTSKSAINKSYETLMKSLVTVLAHTAACAHSTAAISAYNYAYYQYYQQLEEQKKSQGGKKPAEPEPPLPLKVEIEKASNVFNKYKNKISSFFENSKKLETLTKEIGDKIANESSGKPHLTSLNRLLIDYSDNEEDSDEEKSKHDQETPAPIVLDGDDKPKDKEPIQNNENSVHVCDTDVETDDQDSDSEWEILTTSEIKSDAYNQNDKRNYLLPSVKSILFPLKASLDWNVDGPASGQNENDHLIAIEKSKYAITFMGMPRPVNDPIGGKRRTKLADILYGHKNETHS